ncbi:MAG: PorT family protein [Bacteroidales bacterium]|nr:PorT family protein [Bacteroidales bacterium]MDE7127277.1 PorT family protein [Bacteroidales bacterium]
MKRIIILVLSAALLAAGAAESVAQSRYGVIGGMTFSNSKEFSRSTMTQFHAGLTYKLDLPLGFSVQPSLVYNVKGAKMQGVLSGNGSERFDISMGYLELPVSLQWGPDLLIFRPFLDVTPYIGYALNNKLVAAGNVTAKNSWDALQRFEYGMGLGIGLDIWRFQVIGRYNWNFGSLYAPGQTVDGTFPELVRGAFDKSSFGGITLSIAFLFGGGR